MSIERAIPAAGDRVAPKLPGDGRRRASELTSGRPHAQPGLTQKPPRRPCRGLGPSSTKGNSDFVAANLTDRSEPISPSETSLVWAKCHVCRRESSINRRAHEPGRRHMAAAIIDYEAVCSVQWALGCGGQNMLACL
jgi:hypothetical protein